MCLAVMSVPKRYIQHRAPLSAGGVVGRGQPLPAGLLSLRRPQVVDGSVTFYRKSRQ